MSLVSNTTNPDHTSHIKQKKWSIKSCQGYFDTNTTAVTLSSILLTISDTNEMFRLEGDLLKMLANENYNVDLANIPEKNYYLILQRRCTLMEKLSVKKHWG